MTRDLEYEKNNIGYDEQYPRETGGGIKCKNYEICEEVLPSWYSNVKDIIYVQIAILCLVLGVIHKIMSLKLEKVYYLSLMTPNVQFVLKEKDLSHNLIVNTLFVSNVLNEVIMEIGQVLLNFHIPKKLKTSIIWLTKMLIM